MKPTRVQLSRKKGWKLPANTIVVSRPSKWGNPYKVGSPEAPTSFDAYDKFWNYLCCGVGRGHLLQLEAKVELRGKNLACWCHPDDFCHADVLLEIANQ